MRPFLAIKSAAILACVATVGIAAPAFAQTTPVPGMSQAAAQQYAAQYAQQYQQALQQALQNGGGQTPSLTGNAPLEGLPYGLQQQQQPTGITKSELARQLADKNSDGYKANQLARQNRKNLPYFGAPPPKKEPNPLDDMPVPPPMAQLQNINKMAGIATISDDVVLSKGNINLRKESQREAALSYGARGGLAKRAYEVVEELQGYEPTLDSVFNFRAMLIKAPSGLLIEPPIVKESLDATVIEAGGNEAAVADQILKINKQARIVTAPRDWRNYLLMPYDTEIRPPPKILWPKNDVEQAHWNEWVRQGWKEGYEQGEQIFDSQLAQLVADYNGMIRYRTLLAEGKISQPYALQEDRGVTGGRNEMRVGDRALKITGPSQFLTGADLWKPADR